jgi:hypothetical protein
MPNWLQGLVTTCLVILATAGDVSALVAATASGRVVHHVLPPSSALLPSVLGTRPRATPTCSELSGYPGFFRVVAFGFSEPT